MSPSRLSIRTRAVGRTAVLGGLVCLAALIAFHLRRVGHAEGDDFALYLRQARSLFDGDVGAVVADNRYAVLNSDPGFSPIAYPWGWPLLLSPFVQLWGFDYDRLKLVEIAAFCVWLVLLHGIVRRRLGRIAATAVTAVFATAPAYAAHTDQLLTEFPHMAAVATVLWWHDRIRRRTSLLAAPRADLVVLGLLIVGAFNIRRESISLVVVIVVMQLVDAWQEPDPRHIGGRLRSVRESWRRLIVVPVTFALGAMVAQLLLPTELLPDNGNDPGFIDDRWREAPAIVSEQLALGEQPIVGWSIVVLALVGAVVGIRRRPLLDTPLVLLAVLTMVVIGTHFRRIDRYWLQVTPLIVFFVAGALVAAAQSVVGRLSDRPASDQRRRASASLLAVTPLAAVVIGHLAVLPGDISDVRDANAAGRVQDGPAHPAAVEMMGAVVETTPPDAVVAFYRARTMTLLTDRRAIQTRDLARIGSNADFWVQRRDWGFWQPDVDEPAVRAFGFVEVWSNDRYVIWCTDCSG